MIPTRGLLKAVIVQAPWEAAGEPTERVDTQHLLLAITRDEGESALRVLGALEVQAPAIREGIQRF